jgi:predicted outer membrane repeat protein
MKTIILMSVFLILFTSYSIANIINVPADIDSIQGGIDMAVAGDTVLVQPGTYYENINFNGKNITVASLFLATQDQSYILKTIIDGGSKSSVVTFDNEEDSLSVLYGFTITNGSGGVGCGAWCLYWGGGISCYSSSPTLTDLVITKNSGYKGGGMYLYNSNPTLKNTTISNNTASKGGGIYFDNLTIRGGIVSSRPKFDTENRCNIYLNYAVRGSDLYAEREDTLLIEVIVDTFTVSSPTDFHTYRSNNFNFDILNSKIEQMSSELYVNPDGSDSNSGLSAEEPLKTIAYALLKIIADSTNPNTIHLANGEYEGQTIGLSNYISLKGESRDGVIFNSEGDIFSLTDANAVSIENMTILGDGNTMGMICNNSSPSIKNMIFDGAMIRLSGSDPYIENVKISDHLAQAGILMYGSSPTLMNVEITKNNGWPSGGLRVEENSHVNLINCTISGNNYYENYEHIGGIHINSESSINIVNSIIWDNPLYEIGINAGGDLPSTSIMITNSLLKGGANGIHILGGENHLYWLQGNINIDPMFVDTAKGDYSLQEDSPCIDKGIQDTMIIYNDGQDTLYIPSMDYIGVAPDMGAYEYGDPTSSEQEIKITPSQHSLNQNYPNPFNPSTTIEFTLPKSEFVELKVFNILGKEVATLVSNKLNQGNHRFTWDATGNASGVYFYKIETVNYVDIKKCILIK